MYRSYGVHALLNAVCEPEGVGAGGADPRARAGGWDRGDARAPRCRARTSLCSGPGKLTQALGIGLTDNGADLINGPLRISSRPPGWRDVRIAVDARIGITKAVELPWRFSAAGSRFLSRPVKAGVVVA